MFIAECTIDIVVAVNVETDIITVLVPPQLGGLDGEASWRRLC